ncbi:hypothetical protein MANI_002863 [Metarhizium anisopliae]|nr:hypothetical protein MANI_002863 [Metarhizium anisopliae]
MESHIRRPSSTLNVCDAIYDGLLVIKRNSEELLRAAETSVTHQDALRFVKTATSLLIKIFPDMKRSLDLNVITIQIHHIACDLELHLTLPEEINSTDMVVALCQAEKDVRMLHYPRLIAHTARFGDILGSVERCKLLQETLTTAYDALDPVLPEDNIDDNDAESVACSTPYDDLFHSSADRLFHAIFPCESRGSKEVRLRLGAFRSVHPVDDYRSLDILVQRKDETGQFWLTISIHFPRSDMPKFQNSPKCSISPNGAPERRVAFANTEKQSCPWRTNKPFKVGCIWSCAEALNSEFKKWLQHLEFDKSDAWLLHKPVELPEAYAEEECFSDLLSQMTWTDVDKIALAMQLSYALSYHYDDSWLSGRWQQANICFFRWGRRIPCKPWLRVKSLPNQPPQAAPESHFHRFPQLLELGTILLELQIGQSLEASLRKNRARNLDEQWAYATSVFYGKLNNGRRLLSRHYQRAIEFCLRPDESLTQADSIRRSIYENVVRPLEQSIAEADLDDKLFEELDLGSLERTAVRSSIFAEQTEQALPPAADEMINVVSIPQPEEEFAADEIDEGFDLFGDEDGLQPGQEARKASNDWLAAFEKIIQEETRNSKPVSQPLAGQPVGGQNVGDGQQVRRVKVALLDTGVDLKHSYFDNQYPDGQIKSIRSWIGGKDGVEDKDGGDFSGHGTFIASILLKYGPNIDLYVARVAGTRRFRRGTSENVANALYCARVEWGVDIITMSFGYPLGHRGIRDQIIKATQNNILVFAAASNDGRNRPRMFPARQLSVFAIHSTNGHGHKSHFNPPPQRDENFSILGEYIESAWLTGPAEGSGATRCLSGTSFATPIAVCLSSFLLIYVPFILPEHKNFFYKMNTYEGLRNVLQAIVTVDESDAGSRYQYLGVERFFNENNRTAIKEIIRKALSI